MTQVATRKQTKQVHILHRYELKDRMTGKPNGYVVYEVLSSNGLDTYKTTLLNGKATGCSCPATKPCYHMAQLEAKEQARTPLYQRVVAEQREPSVEFLKHQKFATLTSGNLARARELQAEIDARQMSEQDARRYYEMATGYDAHPWA